MTEMAISPLQRRMIEYMMVCKTARPCVPLLRRHRGCLPWKLSHAGPAPCSDGRHPRHPKAFTVKPFATQAEGPLLDRGTRVQPRLGPERNAGQLFAERDE